ncbi:hypothetical protein WDU94_002837, partial [Cyamophila willieti]
GVRSQEVQVLKTSKFFLLHLTLCKVVISNTIRLKHIVDRTVSFCHKVEPSLIFHMGYHNSISPKM